MTLNCDDCLGEFWIGDTQLVGGDPRWCAFDLSVVADALNERGTDVLIPGPAGIIENPRRFAPTPLSIPFAVTGHVDAGGYQVGSVGAEGRCLAAWRHVRGLIRGLKAFAYVEPGGATWTAQGHVHDLDRQTFAGGIWDGLIDITLTRPWEVT